MKKTTDYETVQQESAIVVEDADMAQQTQTVQQETVLEEALEETAREVISDEPMHVDEAVFEVVEDTPKGVYVHKFEEPYVYMGKSYDSIKFNFAKLKGRDVKAIYSEMRTRGIMIINAKFSPDYQMSIASRACGLGADFFDDMPFGDVEVILAQARNFIPNTTFA